jgi:hypothetical protein
MFHVFVIQLSHILHTPYTRTASFLRVHPSYGSAGLDERSVHLFRVWPLLQESHCSVSVENGSPYKYVRNARACGTAGHIVTPLSVFPRTRCNWRGEDVTLLLLVCRGTQGSKNSLLCHPWRAKIKADEWKCLWNFPLVFSRLHFYFFTVPKSKL